MIDYDQVMLDLQTLMKATSTIYDPSNQSKARDVLIDANDRDYVTMNMPLIDLRIKRILPEAKTNTNYYTMMTVEVEIAALDLTTLAEAARIRNGLLRAIQALCKTNRRFASDIDDTILGNVDLATGEDDQTGAFVSGAVMELHIFFYSE